MGKSIITRAALFGAAIFISAAGAGWEVVYESGPVSLSNLDFKTWPVGYCKGFEDRSAGTGGPD